MPDFVRYSITLLSEWKTRFVDGAISSVSFVKSGSPRSGCRNIITGQNISLFLRAQNHSIVCLTNCLKGKRESFLVHWTKNPSPGELPCVVTKKEHSWY